MTNWRWLVRRTTDTALHRCSNIDSYCGLSVQAFWLAAGAEEGLLDVAALFRLVWALALVLAFLRGFLRKHLELDWRVLWLDTYDCSFCP